MQRKSGWAYGDSYPLTRAKFYLQFHVQASCSGMPGHPICQLLTIHDRRGHDHSDSERNADHDENNQATEAATHWDDQRATISFGV